MRPLPVCPVAVFKELVRRRVLCVVRVELVPVGPCAGDEFLDKGGRGAPRCVAVEDLVGRALEYDPRFLRLAGPRRLGVGRRGGDGRLGLRRDRGGSGREAGLIRSAFHALQFPCHLDWVHVARERNSESPSRARPALDRLDLDVAFRSRSLSTYNGL